MTALTLLVAIMGVLSVVSLKPVSGLTVYCATFFLYPQSLRISLGVADFSTARIVIPFLLLKAFFNPEIRRKFKWNRLDTFVVLALFCRCLALTRNVPFMTVLEREGGTFFDTIMPYLAVRFIIRSKSDLLTFIKSLAWIGVPLALMGAYQAVTGKNPADILKIPPSGDLTRSLMGFTLHRSSVTFAGNVIPFGLFFAAVAPLSLGLLLQRKSSPPVTIGLCGILVVGVGASMSSAPLFAVVIAAGMLSAYPLRKYWKPATVFLIACCVFLEFYSNRHFWEVPTRFAFSSRNAAYRIGLLHEAFGGGMDGHWVTGYGYVGVGPGNDNTNFHWRHLDIVNIYIGILARVGLVGLLPYLIVNFLYYHRLYQASQLARRQRDWWLIWCLAAALVGWNVAMMTVPPLGPIQGFLYIMIALCCNMPVLMAKQAALEESGNGGRESARSRTDSLRAIQSPFLEDAEPAARRRGRKPYSRPRRRLRTENG